MERLTRGYSGSTRPLLGFGLATHNAFLESVSRMTWERLFTEVLPGAICSPLWQAE